MPPRVLDSLRQRNLPNYDMQSPRPYDNRWTVQGTGGIYNEQRDAVYLTGVIPEYHQWEPFPPCYEKWLRFLHATHRGRMRADPGTLESHAFPTTDLIEQSAAPSLQ